MIRNEISVVAESLVPSGDKAAAVVIAKALEAFGTPDNWDILAEDYLDELSQVPPDLLKEVWVHARRECKFMPKIADLLSPVKDKILARQIKKRKLEMMLTMSGRNYG